MCVQVLEETNQRTHYIKTLRKTLGDILTQFNTRPRFYYYIFDTPIDRAMVVALRVHKDKKLERKFDEFGIMVLHKQKVKPQATSQYAKTPLTLYTVRLVESIDCAD